MTKSYLEKHITVFQGLKKAGSERRSVTVYKEFLCDDRTPLYLDYGSIYINLCD